MTQLLFCKPNVLTDKDPPSEPKLKCPSVKGVAILPDITTSFNLQLAIDNTPLSVHDILLDAK